MQGVQVRGKSKIGDVDFPCIVGGFGANKKSITDKTIAEIHGVKTIHIRELINKNRKRFQDGIDIVDLKGIGLIDTLKQVGYTRSAITQAKSIYLLSERGYAKLIKIMESDLAWQIHDKLVDEYFRLRDEANIPSYMIEDSIERAKAWIEEERIRKQQLALLEEQKPKVEYFNEIVDRGHLVNLTESAKLLKFPRTKLIDLLIDKKWIYRDTKRRLRAYAGIVKSGYMEVKETTLTNGKVGIQTFTTVAGREKILEMINKEDF